MSTLQLRNPEDWVYAQLFLPREAVPAANEILLENLAPLFATWDTQGHVWFFIRYLEDGYHLRLRVHAQSPACRVQRQQALGLALSKPVEGGAQLRFAMYEPEIDKYCGPQGNCVAERHFCASSAVALHALADDSMSLIERTLRLLASTLESAGLDPVQSATWCRAYYDYWWRAFGASLECQQDDEALFQRSRTSIADKVVFGKPTESNDSSRRIGWLHEWTVALKRDLLALQALECSHSLVDPVSKRENAHKWYDLPVTQLSMLPNFWHMLCNRLGVSIRQEMRVAYCLMRHLSVQHGIEPAPMTMSLIPYQT